MGTSPAEPAAARLFCSECGRPFPPEDVVRFGSNAVCADCKPRYVQQLKEGALPAAGVEYGGFWRRFVAITIDAIILMIVMFPVSMLVFGQLAASGRVGRPAQPHLGYLGLDYLLNLAIGCSYYVYFLSQKSATPGKMVMNLQVLTPSGLRIGVGRALGRFFAHYLSALILFIGYIMAAFDSEKRALHDYICGTRVFHKV